MSRDSIALQKCWLHCVQCTEAKSTEAFKLPSLAGFCSSDRSVVRLIYFAECGDLGPPLNLCRRCFGWMGRQISEKMNVISNVKFLHPIFISNTICDERGLCVVCLQLAPCFLSPQQLQASCALLIFRPRLPQASCELSAGEACTISGRAITQLTGFLALVEDA